MSKKAKGVIPVAKDSPKQPTSGGSTWTARKRSDDLAPFIKDIVDQNIKRHYVRTSKLSKELTEKDLHETLARLCAKFFDTGHMVATVENKGNKTLTKWIQKTKRIFLWKPLKK